MYNNNQLRTLCGFHLQLRVEMRIKEQPLMSPQVTQTLQQNTDAYTLSSATINQSHTHTHTHTSYKLCSCSACTLWELIRSKQIRPVFTKSPNYCNSIPFTSFGNRAGKYQDDLKALKTSPNQFFCPFSFWKINENNNSAFKLLLSGARGWKWHLLEMVSPSPEAKGNFMLQHDSGGHQDERWPQG